MSTLREPELNSYIRKSRKIFEKTLGDLVRIPTVSADPSRHGEIMKAADFALDLLKGIGAQARILKTEGNPLVIGNLDHHEKAPTILIYNHMDVQPAEEETWDQDPFILTIRDGRYGARGTTDNKGPALTVFFAVKYALEQGIPLNFRFVWDFEEEIGSPHFEKAVHSRKDLLRADSILVSDTVWISRKKPAIPFGIRGLLTATLVLQTGNRDAHSGLVGGAARNPVGELCALISSCYDPKSGEVRIPGFYDNLLEPGKEEVQGFLESGFRVPEFKKAHGLERIRFDKPAQVVEAIWSRPTFEVHGLSGGYTGRGVKTIVPHRAEAKISMRLVPRQEPQEIFSKLRDFIKKQNPDVQVKLEAVLDPYLGSPKGKFLQAAIEAVTFGFQNKPALIREGGSIGAVVSLNRLLNAPVILLSLSLPEHGYHAPNEYFEWRQVRGGIRTCVHYFDQISRIPSAP